MSEISGRDDDRLDAAATVWPMVRAFLLTDDPRYAPTMLEYMALVLMLSNDYSLDELRTRFNTIRLADSQFNFEQFFNELLIKMHRANNKPVPMHLLKNRYSPGTGVTEKQCARCGATKSRTQYYRDVQSKDGLRAYCSDCDKAMSKRCRKRKADHERQAV